MEFTLQRVPISSLERSGASADRRHFQTKSEATDTAEDISGFLPKAATKIYLLRRAMPK